MNNWQALGYIALGFGFVFFLTGIYLGFQAAPTQRNFVMLPFMMYTALSWVVSVVAMTRGHNAITS